MDFNVNAIIIIICGNEVVLDELGNFPEINIDNKSVYDSAADLFEQITDIKVIREYSGWVFLKFENFYDEPLRMKDEKRLISFVYSIFLPEKVKILKEGLKWKMMSKVNQKIMLDKVLFS